MGTTTRLALAIIAILSICHLGPRPAVAQVAPATTSVQSAAVKAVLDRIDGICQAAPALTYSANVTVSITDSVTGRTKRTNYTVAAVFQHPVYAKITEAEQGRTVLILISNPQHLYVYNPDGKSYIDDGNVPVDFAVEDMLLTGGVGGNVDLSVASAPLQIGYFVDISGYFSSSYDGASLWPSPGTRQESIATETVQQSTVNGETLNEVTSTVQQGRGTTTWNVYFDSKTGFPVRETLTASGPSFDGKPDDPVQVTADEEYTSFTPTSATYPGSAFTFTIPLGATLVTQ